VSFPIETGPSGGLDPRNTVKVSKISEAARLGLLAAVHEVMASRPADFTAGDQYLERWRLAPYGDNANIYIHRFTGDDEDAAAHCHPYDNVSMVLDEAYYEWFHRFPVREENGKLSMYATLRLPGDVIERPARIAHRLSMVEDRKKPVITLFTTGPRIRNWSFHCPKGLVHFADFLKDNGGRKGCS
jgi:hypothetical protein